MGDEQAPWAGLQSQARGDGKGRGRTIKFDKNNVNQAGDVVHALADLLSIYSAAAHDLGGKSKIGGSSAEVVSNITENAHHFGEFDSGVRLSDLFRDAATDLVNNLMPKYVEAATHIGRAFLDATKEMVGTEEETAEEFKRLVSGSKAGEKSLKTGADRQEYTYKTDRGDAPTTVSTYVHTAPQQPSWTTSGSDGNSLPSPVPRDEGSKSPFAKSKGDPKYAVPMSHPARYPGAVDPTKLAANPNVVVPENAESLTYRRAVELGLSLQGRSAALNGMAGDWNRIAARIETGTRDVHYKITDLTAPGVWEGNTATTAKAAVDAYVGAANQLTDGMREIGRLLSNGAGWTSVVHSYMPVGGSPYADPTPEVESQIMAVAREAYSGWYMEGVRATSMVPKLPPPTGIQGAAPGPQLPGVPGEGVPGGIPGGMPGLGAGPGGGAMPRVPKMGDMAGMTGLAGGGSGHVPSTVPANYLDPESGRAQAARAAAQLEEQGRAAADQAKQREDWAAQQQAANEQAKQQAAEQQARQQSEQAAQQAKQGMDQGMQAAQQAMAAAVDAAKQAAAKGMQEQAKEYAAGLPGLGKPDINGAAGLGRGGGGPGGGLGGATPMSREALSAAKLFPRASLPGQAIAGANPLARAGLAGPMSGGPGPGPHPGNAAGANQAKDPKKAEYLKSAENLEEALGDPVIVTIPVAGQQ
ncbi:WXG100 family type VII secretion target [Nocardia panacis]|nr:hypothetical protein [Nocardia panacis]